MSATVWVLIAIAWIVGGPLCAIYVFDDSEMGPAGFWLAPASIVAAAVKGAYCGARYVLAAPKRQDARIEKEYQETLRLIEWKPRPVSRIAEVEEALAIEGGDENTETAA